VAKKRKPKLVPRLGPATNVRPAGAHQDKRRKALEAAGKAALLEEAALGAHRSEDERR